MTGRKTSGGFPGAVFNEAGTSLDASIPDLTQAAVGRLRHRSMVAQADMAPIARTWVLQDEATFATIPAVLQIEAVELVLSGQAILILAARAAASDDVTYGLVGAVDLYAAPEHGMGRA